MDDKGAGWRGVSAGAPRGLLPAGVPTIHRRRVSGRQKFVCDRKSLLNKIWKNELTMRYD